jgi:hypothetical protein
LSYRIGADQQESPQENDAASNEEKAQMSGEAFLQITIELVICKNKRSGVV